MPAKKKTPAKKTVKKAVKKASAKKPAAKKTTGKSVKKVATKKKVAAEKDVTETSTPTEKKSVPFRKAVVSRSGAVADKKSTPIVFSIDEIEELMASKKSAGASTKEEEESSPKKEVAKPKVEAPKKVVVEDKPVEKRVLGAASLADILGFNPAEKKKKIELDDNEVPKKFKKYYKLLVELRTHVSDEINLHTSETLKHSSRDDSGDLSSYGSHQADAGTDTFDRDFALSLVSSEQEALNEIEEAILRIKNGSYGVCEVTGKPIPAARLAAVPFARYSVEGQIEHEKNRHRKNNRSASVGIFGDVGDAPKLESSDDDDD
jgi:RNA polymerase-binding transcription factor DksA